MIDIKLMINAIGCAQDSLEVNALLAELPLNYERSEAPEMEEFYFHFKSEGVSLLFDVDGYLVTIFLYVVPKEGFAEYSGWLGKGVSRGCKQPEVEGLMGSPIATGKAGVGMFNLYNPAWSKHKYEGIFLHYQYGEHTGTIEMLTIMIEK